MSYPSVPSSKRKSENRKNQEDANVNICNSLSIPLAIPGRLPLRSADLRTRPRGRRPSHLQKHGKPQTPDWQLDRRGSLPRQRRSITEETGTYKISSALEGTYLEEQVEFHRKDDLTKHHSFLVFITYNPVTKKYDSTYLYSRWALRVTETGEFDEKTKEYRTTAFIPLEDGTRDENVRTITKLAKPNEIEYSHYSRYSNETSELLNLVVTMTPKP